MREVHLIELRAQALAAEAGTTEIPMLDVLLETATSPLRLVFSRARTDTFPIERCLAAEGELGRALATVAPREMLGFESVGADALEGRADPEADGERKALLDQILTSRVLGAKRVRDEELDRLRERVFAGEAHRAGRRGAAEVPRPPRPARRAEREAGHRRDLRGTSAASRGSACCTRAR